MLFDGNITIDAFVNIYGGKRHRRITVPEGFPFIYLVLPEEGRRHNTDDRIIEQGSTVHFSYEGVGEITRGNRTVINHNSIQGTYYSIFVFEKQRIDNEMRIVCLGEYEYDHSVRGERTGKNYFILNKLEEPVTDAEVFYSDEDGILRITGTVRNYFDSYRNILNAIRNDNAENDVYMYDEAIEGEFYRRRGREFENVNVDISSREYRRAMQLQMEMKCINRKARRIAKIPYEKVQIEGNELQSVFIYCINVGVGKTVFAVLQYHEDIRVWCFDFGIESLRGNIANERRYRANIAECIEHIQLKFGLTEFVFDKLFVSHGHYDHISEISGIYLDENTEVYTGLHTNCPTNVYRQFMAHILGSRCHLVESVCRNSNGAVEILHPARRIVYPNRTGRRRTYWTSKLNNVSSIIKIRLNDKEVVFSGDIEGQGWRWFINAAHPVRNEIECYFHSHHGSPNGFCFNVGGTPHTVYDYYEAENEFVTTRDGAIFGRHLFYVDMRIHHTARRTDMIPTLKYYEYDVLTNNVAIY